MPPNSGGRNVSIPPPPAREEFHTGEHIAIRRFDGDLPLERAVNIALRQNPQVLTAIQEIERTRGQIIEVRAAALPHITATGDYEEQDRRLIRGGGGGTGSSSSLTSGSLGGVDTTGTAAGSTATGGTTTASQTPTATVGSSGGGNVTSGNATTSSTGANGSTASNSSTDSSKQLSALFSGSSSSNFIQNKSWNVQLEVRQAIYAGGQIRAALKIAQLTSDSAYYSLRDVIDTIISTTRQQFYNVLLTRALILVQEESVRLLEQQLQDQQNRFEAGTVPRFNVLQAEVALANARPDLIRARNNYLIAQFNLAKTLNLDPGPGGRTTFHCVGVLNASVRQISLPDAIGARARAPAFS